MNEHQSDEITPKTVALKAVPRSRRMSFKLMQAHLPTPPPAHPVPIPLTWLERSFSTRSRTEQLLRPELDDGVITQHDFDAAVDFFPGAQRYYSVR